MHPARLAAVPVGQDTAAYQPCFGMGAQRRHHLDEVPRIDPVIIVDEGHGIRIELRQCAVKGVRLAGHCLKDPVERQSRIVCFPIALEIVMRGIDARIRHHEQAHLGAIRPLGGVKGGDGPREELDTVMRANEDRDPHR